MNAENGGQRTSRSPHFLYNKIIRCYGRKGTLLDKDIKNADEITKQIKAEFVNNPNWKTSERELRNLRKGATFAVLNEEEDIDKAAAIIEDLFNHLFLAYNL